MQRRNFLRSFAALGVVAGVLPSGALASSKKEGKKDKISQHPLNVRAYWCELLYRMAHPVFSNLANNTLVQNMPVEKAPNYDSRQNVTYLEAVGRSLAGIAPWLALPDDDTEEGAKRKELRGQVLKGLTNCVDPQSPDYLNFRKEYQPIVDAAYVVHGFVRAPKALWEPLDELTKSRFVTEFKALRTRKPFNSNWLLFTALTETFLLSIGEQWEKQSVDHALGKFQEWYVGDGWYSDGPVFAFDYYNAFVIHPMLVDTLKILAEKGQVPQQDYDVALKRMMRYVDQQERMIAPDGTFPVIGRSITYRTSCFQALAQATLMEKLPQHVTPAQVRCALTAMKQKMYVDGTFNDKGWLQLGFCGHQPEVADYYTSTGSLYMATLSFLPLGLPATHPFWSAPDEAWTSQKAWGGKSFVKDYHVKY